MAEQEQIQGAPDGAAPAATVPTSLLVCCSDVSYRTEILTPFAIKHEGRQWACATDGHCLAAVPFDGELRTDGPDTAPLFPRVPLSHKTRVAALRDWAGKPQSRDRCSCDHCFCEEECCRGMVEVPRYARLLDGVLNLNLLCHVLESAPFDAEVRFLHAEPLGPFVFRTDDWIGMIMPIRPDDGEAQAAGNLFPASEAIASSASAPKAPQEASRGTP